MRNYRSWPGPDASPLPPVGLFGTRLWWTATADEGRPPTRASADEGDPQTTRNPRIRRAITSRWIWLVPSPISVSLASRKKRSTGYSVT